MFNIFPSWLYEEIQNQFVLEFLYEVRIRANKPICVNYRGSYQILTSHRDRIKPIIAGNDLIEYIVSVATKQSLYAYNDQIKHCYIIADNGIRIGICGTVVYENGKVMTIKNISSLNIRVSHQVYNCSEKIINFIYQNNIIKNTLIVSPPGAGKTTLIRDISLKLSNEKKVNNILIVDERYEIAGDKQTLDVGMFADVISGSEKKFAFHEALKTMCPSVIITDEISAEEDIEQIEESVKCGVAVIASCHAGSIEDIKNKRYFKSILSGKYFERIIVLSKRNGVGTIEGVFDENLRCLYLPYLT